MRALLIYSSQEVISSSEERRAERAQRKGAEDFDEEEAEALEASLLECAKLVSHPIPPAHCKCCVSCHYCPVYDHHLSVHHGVQTCRLLVRP
jgi:hypothetical protein